MINNIDQIHIDTLKYILENGTEREDRTGTGTIGVFGHQIKIDVSERFPLLTTKKINFDSVLHETLWMFVQGSTNTKYLTDNNVKIWNEWSVNGELGPIYGEQARRFSSWKYVTEHDAEHLVSVTPVLQQIDQLQTVIDSLQKDPFSRRHVMTLWNPSTVPDGKISFKDNLEQGNSVLPVCHGAVIQFYVEKNNQLSLHMYQRSCDAYLGKPFNYANYGLLLYMVAQVTNLKPKNLVISYGDLHIYKNHLTAIDTLFSRPIDKDSPVLLLDSSITNINDFKFNNFSLKGYDPYPYIKAPISV